MDKKEDTKKDGVSHEAELSGQTLTNVEFQKERVATFMTRVECGSIADIKTLLAHDEMGNMSLCTGKFVLSYRHSKNDQITPPYAVRNSNHHCVGSINKTNSNNNNAGIICKSSARKIIRQCYSSDILISEPLICQRFYLSKSLLGDAIQPLWGNDNGDESNSAVTQASHAHSGGTGTEIIGTYGNNCTLIGSGFIHDSDPKKQFPVECTYTKKSYLRRMLNNQFLSHPFIRFSSVWTGSSEYAILNLSWFPKKAFYVLVWLQDRLGAASGQKSLAASVSYDISRTNPYAVADYAKGAFVSLKPVTNHEFYEFTIHKNDSGSLLTTLGVPHPNIQLFILMILVILPWVFSPIWEFDLTDGIFSAWTYLCCVITCLVIFPPKILLEGQRLKHRQLGNPFSLLYKINLVIQIGLILTLSTLILWTILTSKIELSMLTKSLYNTVKNGKVSRGWRTGYVDYVALELDALDVDIDDDLEIASKGSTASQIAKSILRIQNTTSNILFSVCMLILCPKLIRMLRLALFRRRFSRKKPDFVYRNGSVGEKNLKYNIMTNFNEMNNNFETAEYEEQTLLQFEFSDEKSTCIFLSPGDIVPVDSEILNVSPDFQAEEDVTFSSGCTIYADDYLTGGRNIMREGTNVIEGTAHVRILQSPFMTKLQAFEQESALHSNIRDLVDRLVYDGYIPITYWSYLGCIVFLIIRFFLILPTVAERKIDSYIMDCLVILTILISINLLASPIHILPRSTQQWGGGISSEPPTGMICADSINKLRRRIAFDNSPYILAIYGLESVTGLLIDLSNNHNQNISYVSCIVVENNSLMKDFYDTFIIKNNGSTSPSKEDHLLKQKNSSSVPTYYSEKNNNINDVTNSNNNRLVYYSSPPEVMICLFIINEILRAGLKNELFPEPIIPCSLYHAISDELLNYFNLQENVSVYNLEYDPKLRSLKCDFNMILYSNHDNVLLSQNQLSINSPKTLKIQFNLDGEKHHKIEKIHQEGNSRHPGNHFGLSISVFLNSAELFTMGYALHSNYVNDLRKKLNTSIFEGNRVENGSITPDNVTPPMKVVIGSNLFPYNTLNAYINGAVCHEEDSSLNKLEILSGVMNDEFLLHIDRSLTSPIHEAKEITPVLVISHLVLDEPSKNNVSSEAVLSTEDDILKFAFIRTLPNGRVYGEDIRYVKDDSNAGSDNNSSNQLQLRLKDSILCLPHLMESARIGCVLEYISHRYTRRKGGLFFMWLGIFGCSAFFAGLVWSLGSLQIECVTSVLNERPNICATNLGTYNADQPYYDMMWLSLGGILYHPWVILLVILGFEFMRIQSLDPKPINIKATRRVLRKTRQKPFNMGVQNKIKEQQYGLQNDNKIVNNVNKDPLKPNNNDNIKSKDTTASSGEDDDNTQTKPTNEAQNGYETPSNDFPATTTVDDFWKDIVIANE